MFYHLKIMLRNLHRNITYSGINIAGLAIGVTASVFIFLWVHHERSFDKFHADVDRIYRIINTFSMQGNSMTGDRSSYRLAAAVKDIPEIENAAAAFISDNINGVKVTGEDFSVAGKSVYVDEAWFELFDYQLLEGSFSAFGNHPYSVALTESEARKYFGNTSAIGQTIGIQGVDYMVQAVVKNLPDNSSFPWDMMVSMDALLADPVYRGYSERWEGANMFIVFVKLRKDADNPEVCQKINELYLGNGITYVKASLRLLTDIHFETDISYTSFLRGDSKAVSLFSILGVLLLLTACINYVNLTTARVNVRTKEVGIRKIVGAKRSALFMQFISESFVVCSIAVLASLILIWILSPFYYLLVENAVLDFSSPVIWIILAAILFAVTLLNGIYPALQLSSFRPMNFLKGIGSLKMKGGNLRRGLVVFQFALSTSLIISVTVIYKQTQYIRQMNPGYNREQVVSLKLPAGKLWGSKDDRDKIIMALQNVKRELQSQPSIVGAALCSENITSVTTTLGGADWDGRAEDFNPGLVALNADADYMQTLGLELVEGRWFEEGRKADEAGIILNETAIRELNIREPYIGQHFTLMGIKGNIIGIVEDFHFRSLHEKISPLVLHQSRFWSNYVTIKTYQGKHAEAVQAAKSVWIEFFPNDPFEYTFLDDAFNNLYKADIRTSQLMLVFSILAIVIASLGLFGLSTFAIERRTKEIGIRKVLGASVSGIIHLLTREFLVLVTVAFAIAAPVAWWVMSRWLNNFAYHINITVWIFVFGAMITLLIALIAIGVQALKAATANPVKAIKSE